MNMKLYLNILHSVYLIKSNNYIYQPNSPNIVITILSILDK